MRVAIRKGYIRIGVWFLLAVYILVLFWMLFVHDGLNDRQNYFKTYVKEREVHLVPFVNTYQSLRYVYSDDFRHPDLFYYRLNVIKGIVGNLVLLLPWGFLSPFLFPRLRTVKNIALVSFAISLSAELAQYIFQIGIFDIDDVLYNTAGAILGFYLFRKSLTFFSSGTN